MKLLTATILLSALFWISLFVALSRADCTIDHIYVSEAGILYTVLKCEDMGNIYYEIREGK